MRLALQSSSVPNLHTGTVEDLHANSNSTSSAAVRSGTIPGSGVDFVSDDSRPDDWQTVRGPGVTYSVPFPTHKRARKIQKGIHQSKME